MRIDQEALVRSNCIWSLGRLYDHLLDPQKGNVVEGLFLILLEDIEPSVRYEARIALEQIKNPDILNRLRTLADDGFLL